MPMIDVYAAAGTFPDPHTLARDLAAAAMRWEQVPDLPLFTKNTAAFIHDMDAAAISNVAETAATSAFKCSRLLGCSIATSNSGSWRSSPTSSRLPPAIQA